MSTDRRATIQIDLKVVYSLRIAFISLFSHIICPKKNGNKNFSSNRDKFPPESYDFATTASDLGFLASSGGITPLDSGPEGLFHSGILLIKGLRSAPILCSLKTFRNRMQFAKKEILQLQLFSDAAIPYSQNWIFVVCTLTITDLYLRSLSMSFIVATY
jgi:hypothetical protein